MKTLKFLFAVCIMLGFMTNAVDAQPVRTSFDATMYIECAGEYATGTLQSMWSDNEHMWLSIVEGELIGETTNTVYRIHSIFSERFNANENNQNNEDTFTGVSLVFANNKLIQTFNFKAHFTVNAIGDLTALKLDDWITVCK